MATIPTGTFIAAQRCRQLQQRAAIMTNEHQVVLSSVSTPDVNPLIGPPTSPLIGPPTSPLIGPPTSPLIGPPTGPLVGPPTSPLSSPTASPPVSPPVSPRKQDPLVNPSPLARLNQFFRRSTSTETDVGASASGLTQSLEASHHTSSITSMT